MSTSELLEQWREATRAAKIAERAAKHAERTARIAREAAERAMAFAAENRAGYLADAEETVDMTRQEESQARERYHQAEREARQRHQDR